VGCLAASLVILGRLGSTTSGVAMAYIVIAAMVAGTTVVSLLLLREPASRSMDAGPRPSAAGASSLTATIRGALAGGWRATLADHDFRWVITTRFFQTLGIWTILPFVTFYCQDVVRAANYGAASDLWQLCILAGGLVPAIVCGYLSDRSRRRKLFVYLSSGLQGLVTAVLLFTLVSDLPTLFAMGILFGVGYGAYSAVDW